MASRISNSTDGPRLQRFTIRTPRVVSVSGWLVFVSIALLLVASNIPGERTSGVVLLIPSCFFLVRSFLCATVLVSPTEVRFRSIIRTRRIPVTEIVDATTSIGRTGYNGFNREFVSIRRRDGSTVAFKELNNRAPGHEGSRTVTRAAAQAINVAVRACEAAPRS